MNHIVVPYLSSNQSSINLESFERWISLPKHQLDIVNWPEFPYKPDVCFSMAHTDAGIFLKFWVVEEGIRGLVTEDLGMVYTDSCVELFIDPAGDGCYYNFEFNCLGTLLLACGASRNDREKATRKILDQVLRYPSLGLKPIEQDSGQVKWDLTVFIPFEAFFNHPINSFSGKTIRANLQKCGDKMKVPHFITWNSISTPKPDYHRPEFFGELYFEQG
jgi:hypothetical protein